MSAELKGYRELSKQLQALGAAVGGKTLRSATLLATTPVMREARRRIPVGVDAHKTYKGRVVAPGFAKRSIARKAFLSRDKSTAYCIVGVKPEAYYALQFVEMGTSKQSAQPWLEPAFRATQDEQIERLGANLRKKILAAVKKQ